MLSFKAFCQIDQQLFQTAFDSLRVAQQFTRELVAEKISAHGSLSGAQIDELIHQHIADKSAEWRERKKRHNLALTPLESDILYLKRVDWILRYHLSLCLYMQMNFAEAEEVLLGCLTPDCRKFVPDDLSLGTLLFFLALTQTQLQKFGEADAHLAQCAATHWVDAQHNRFLHRYVAAKLRQCQGQHAAAVESFTEALALSPDNPFCLFKRAWSHKVRSRDFSPALCGDADRARRSRWETSCARARTSSGPRRCGPATRTSRWTTGASRGASIWSSAASPTSCSRSRRCCQCPGWLRARTLSILAVHL